MNILVVGGGTKGKFGNDFVLKARAAGHNVVIISHAPNGNNDPQQFIADFDKMSNVVDTFKVATANFDHIDIMLYNTNAHAYPAIASQYTEHNYRMENYYQRSIQMHVMAPHVLAIECFKKMLPGSKIIFMTSGLAFEFTNNLFSEQAGYAGAKAYQLHLMKGLAHNNNKNVIVSSISTEFLYDEPENYRLNVDTLYSHIVTHGSKFNGKIVLTDGRSSYVANLDVVLSPSSPEEVDVE
jgi:NAD(P)-dependent dehydrogenase (short-subunit alcohol dehydrogenase family)